MCMGYAYIPRNLSVRQHNAVGLRLFDETRTISDWHAHQLQAHFFIFTYSDADKRSPWNCIIQLFATAANTGCNCLPTIV